MSNDPSVDLMTIRSHEKTHLMFALARAGNVSTPLLIVAENGSTLACVGYVTNNAMSCLVNETKPQMGDRSICSGSMLSASGRMKRVSAAAIVLSNTSRSKYG